METNENILNAEETNDTPKLYITYDINTRKVLRIDNTNMGTLDGTDTVEMDGDINSDEVFDLLLCRYVDGEFVKDEELVKSNDLNKLRSLREPLLKAFDIYKSNVMYGTVTEDDNQKVIITEWYKKMLDLDENAINNPPSVIAKYL